MNYLSVCSGIEAATVAWHPLGWNPVAFADIEPFPSAVLAHHYPAVPNHGDMSKFNQWPDHAIDLLVGGTPCQAFSIAGLRKGLDDPRGNLTLTFLALARRYQPRWIVWENVPGVLSVKGNPFGQFLAGLAELGYGCAYRVLDAQYFGVAQRRRRVFVVGYLGAWQPAAAVLLEPESLRGDSPPRRQTRQNTAHTLAARTNGGGGLGTDAELDGALVPSWPAEVAPTLNAHFGEKQGLEDQHALGGAGLFVPTFATSGQANAAFAENQALALNATNEAPYIAHSLRAEGFDASEDGTGRGTPIVPVGIDGGEVGFALRANASHSGDKGDGGVNTTFAIQERAVSENPNAGPQGKGYQEDKAYTLEARHHVQAIAFAENSRSEVRLEGGDGTRTGALSTGGGKPGQGVPMVAGNMAVRRLTPRECERLQGFPDDYTRIPWRGKPAEACPDGPRYKALGNSMAVPVMHWIGQRLAQVAETLKARKEAA